MFVNITVGSKNSGLMAFLNRTILVSSVVVASGTLCTRHMNLIPFCSVSLVSRILPMLHNSSAFFKKMSGVGRNIWPTRNDGGSETGDSMKYWVWKCSPDWRFQAVIKDMNSKTSMILDHTTAAVEIVWQLCKIRWIAAFSIVLLCHPYQYQAYCTAAHQYRE